MVAFLILGSMVFAYLLPFHSSCALAVDLDAMCKRVLHARLEESVLIMVLQTVKREARVSSEEYIGGTAVVVIAVVRNLHLS